mmetsp:Transcript_4235/g.7079  ORF Transcript_4235/g.7079 Transcript_4235/m.7079 type:complete len:225 (-) Transcript_4235:86-760(-)
MSHSDEQNLLSPVRVSLATNKIFVIGAAKKPRLMFLLSFISHLRYVTGHADDITAENKMLKLRLRALEDQLQEEAQFSYVVVKGYITGAENVFLETMSIDEAKAYCNSNPGCKGFTFGGSDERPEDEVTVTFKAGSKVAPDMNWVSYVKESSMFGALHGAMTLEEASSPAVIVHVFTFESICIVFAVTLVLVFVCRGRCSWMQTLAQTVFGARGSGRTQLLPGA